MRQRRASTFIRRLVMTGILVITLSCLGATSATAEIAGHRPNLVVLGDSFAAGVGNSPYRNDSPCKTSDAAYGPLLDRVGLVTLEAFPACSGATTEQVWGTGRHGDPPQLDSISADTDIVTVGALGNDFHVSQIEGLCIVGDCSVDNPLVQQVLADIPVSAPPLLDELYSRISAVPGFDGRVFAVAYPNPFPSPDGVVGPNCPYMTPGELVTAQTITDLFNSQIRQAAIRHGFGYVPVTWLFRGHDMCGSSTAFFTPGPPAPSVDPEGAVHPNRFGQQLLAVAVGVAVSRWW